MIGIALLASPILRTKPRDNWLRWTPDPFAKALRDGVWSADDAVEALRTRLNDSISEIRHDDFASSGDFANPTENLIFDLERLAAGAAAQRDNFLRKAYSTGAGGIRSQKDHANQDWSEDNWRSASEDILMCVSGPKPWHDCFELK